MLFAIVVVSLTFMVTTLAIGVLMPAARSWGLVDRPGGRRDHEAPTPAIGGIAILLAAVPLGLWLLPLTPQVRGLGLASVVLLVAGVADDIFRIRWQYRLCAQILSALILIYVGGVVVSNVGQVFGFPTRPLGPLGVPLTIVAMVGLINAFNMSDGVDGLAASIGLAACLMLGGIALYVGNYDLAAVLALVCGGLVAFLMFNLRLPWNPRARIFLGNAGSEFIGLFVAYACIRLTQNTAHPVGVQIAPFLVAPVLIDCLTLMVRRVLRGASPFLGDRNHLHHTLLDGGLTPTAVVILIVGSNFLIGGMALLALKAHVPAISFSLMFLGLWSGYFLATRRRDQNVAFVARLFGGMRWTQRRDLQIARTAIVANDDAPSDAIQWTPVYRAARGDGVARKARALTAARAMAPQPKERRIVWPDLQPMPARLLKRDYSLGGERYVSPDAAAVLGASVKTAANAGSPASPGTLYRPS